MACAANGGDNIPNPTLSANATQAEELQWTRDHNLHVKNKQKCEDEKAWAFAMILGQCDETMKNKAESKGSVHEKTQHDSDVIALLCVTKESAFDAREKQHAPRQAAVAWKQLVHLHQQNEKRLVQCHSWFVEMAQRMEGLFGGVAPTAVAKKDKGCKETDAEKVSKARGCAFHGGGVKGFRPLLRHLENDQALGALLCPESNADALQVMMQHQEQPIHKSIMKNVNKKFTTTDDKIPDFSFMMSEVEMMKKHLCFKCGKPGTQGCRLHKEEVCVKMLISCLSDCITNHNFSLVSLTPFTQCTHKCDILAGGDSLNSSQFSFTNILHSVLAH